MATITLSKGITSLLRDEVLHNLMDSINDELGYDEDIEEICVTLSYEFKFEAEVYYQDGSMMNTTLGTPNDYVL